MLRIRLTEETLADRYQEQEMRTPTHFSIGQEAVAVGVCAALRQDDVVYSGHRCHAHYLAKGGSLLGMVAELYGRQIGCAGGRGGSVHLNAPEAGFIAASAILGETLAAAAGSAWAFAMDRAPRVAVSFFGDGVVEEGIFHETLNFAVLKTLPLVLVCENNLYSTHTPLSVRQPAGLAIWQRAKSYEMQAEQVDGNNVFAVHEAASRAVQWARDGRGPYLLECLTYRWREHVGPNFDIDFGYRTQEELDSWMDRCPIKHAEAVLTSAGQCTPVEIRQWRQEFQEAVDQAIETARQAPFPAVADLLAGTY